MKVYIILSLIVMIFLTAFFLLKGCNNIVSSVDGERRSKMIPLSNDYFYGELDKKIWRLEKSTQSYKNIINGTVDSLSWCDDNIYGHSNLTYFIINTNVNNVEYFSTRNSLQVRMNLQNQNCKSISGVPSL